MERVTRALPAGYIIRIQPTRVNLVARIASSPQYPLQNEKRAFVALSLEDKKINSSAEAAWAHFREQTLSLCEPQKGAQAFLSLIGQFQKRKSKKKRGCVPPRKLGNGITLAACTLHTLHRLQEMTLAFKTLLCGHTGFRKCTCR